MINPLSLSMLQNSSGFPGGSDSKESACNAGEPGLIPGLGQSLEKGMATHSSILARGIPWTEEPGGLQSIGYRLTKSRTQVRDQHFHFFSPLTPGNHFLWRMCGGTECLHVDDTGGWSLPIHQKQLDDSCISALVWCFSQWNLTRERRCPSSSIICGLE